MKESIKAEIRSFLESDPFYQESIKPGFSDDMKLVSSGAIDSIGIFNLIIFLEGKFNISLSMEDLLETNFSTLENLSCFIESKI